MCSVDDGGLQSMVKEVIDTNDTNYKCNKCGQECSSSGLYKSNHRAGECRECFLSYTRHKFRAALGSSKLLPKDAHVMVIFDGSDEAMVLLDMLHYAQAQNSFKRLHCYSKLVYIDDGHPNVDKCRARIENLKQFMSRYADLEYFIVAVGDPNLKLYDQHAINNYLERSLEKEFKFAQLISSMHSETSREDFVKNYKKNIISRVGKHLNCFFAMNSKTSSSLAADLLSAISLGRGASIANDVDVLDNSLGEIKLLRPLRDLTQVEVSLYLRAQQLESLELIESAPGVETIYTNSLQNLTKSFINNLQINYPSTVSTIFRTGNKIAINCLDPDEGVKEIDNEITTVCSLCSSTALPEKSTTLAAIRFSRLISERSSQMCNEDLSDENHHADENTQLCHSCQKISKDCVDSSILTWHKTCNL